MLRKKPHIREGSLHSSLSPKLYTPSFWYSFEEKCKFICYCRCSHATTHRGSQRFPAMKIPEKICLSWWPYHFSILGIRPTKSAEVVSTSLSQCPQSRATIMSLRALIRMTRKAIEAIHFGVKWTWDKTLPAHTYCREVVPSIRETTERGTPISRWDTVFFRASVQSIDVLV